MRNLFKNFDFLILICVIFLTIFGLAIIGSVTPKEVNQQLIFFIVGFICFVIFSQIDFQIYKSFAWIIYGFGSVSVLFTLILGTLTRGSARWFNIGLFSIQPSELFKPFLIIFLAYFISESSNKDLTKIKNLIIFLILFLVPTLIVFKQPDLGNVIVYCSFLLAIFFYSGINIKYILSGIILMAFSTPLIWHFLKNYQKQRITTFLNPGSDPLGQGYNILQSIIAVGSGQLFGRGFGRGTQSHLKFLPEFHTDFVFASLSEEFGLIGVSILIGVYCLLLSRILILIKETNDRFAKLILIANFVMLSSQIFINIGMNIGILPITGITLPLISYGGSSILSIMISLGIIENIAKNRPQKTIFEIK